MDTVKAIAAALRETMKAVGPRHPSLPTLTEVGQVVRSWLNAYDVPDANTAHQHKALTAWETDSVQLRAIYQDLRPTFFGTTSASPDPVLTIALEITRANGRPILGVDSGKSPADVAQQLRDAADLVERTRA
ncbi:hypothetical protein [Amycolatopsis sp. CA-230715]|uniref:hypothetical protein n=1 Tax=Amycolatopsis sp. CA-230715 TaxID=2745196 RepID=UPI001C03094F|nr:hypothetical protein [Amycolatopsis sp. CA-230715]QWF85902.1 hypothetical protein HUW46_09382 [Amycolatopsis sp. CA-230715]